MIGEGLSDLKRRIKSVKNTQKITRAAGLVATSKFKKVKPRAESAATYFEKFTESFERIISNADAHESAYLKGNGSTQDLYVIITSDTGLSGSYNANIVREALVRMKEERPLLITLGQKGRNYFKRRGFETLAEYVDIGTEPSLKEIREIAGHILKAFHEKKAGRIFLMYTRFHSAIRQNVEVLQLLPIDKKKTDFEEYIEFDPSPAEVFQNLIPIYISHMLYYSLMNSIASEHSSRMRAMDTATRNAQDILDRLNSLYNRARQSAITQEITEIVGGAEALKD